MKKNNTGETVAEIKKERLKKHLNKEVPNLIQEWVKQLNAPEPFAYMDHDIWGWQSPYRPILKQDPDSNHILRRHLRSRALWRYHTDWEGKLDSIRIWNKILTQEEITSDFNGDPISRKKLVADYPFDTACRYCDLSGNENYGTQTNTEVVGGHNTTEDDIESMRVNANSKFDIIPLANGRETLAIHIEEA